MNTLSSCNVSFPGCYYTWLEYRYNPARLSELVSYVVKICVVLRI